MQVPAIVEEFSTGAYHQSRGLAAPTAVLNLC